MDQPKTPLLERPLFRVLLIWVVQTAALLIMAWLMGSVVVDNLAARIVAAAVIGLLNALLWPLLSYVLVPFAILTLGLAAPILRQAIDQGFMPNFGR